MQTLAILGTPLNTKVASFSMVFSLAQRIFYTIKEKKN